VAESFELKDVSASVFIAIIAIYFVADIGRKCPESLWGKIAL
jgi:hypothetical protein